MILKERKGFYMKKLRGLFVVILTILISLSFTGISSVHAAGEKLSVKVYKNTNSRETGLYKVNNGGTVSGQTQAEVFKLVAKDRGVAKSVIYKEYYNEESD